ncbi:MAG: family 43 glycosylhydrolase [Opitutales bacterium]|nr:family 43 glycosylhydrolase [Opitutales bacterium]
MNWHKMIGCCAGILVGLLGYAQDVPYPEGAKGVVRPIVHDPVIIGQNGVYYMFHTGPGITSWRSSDRVHWDTIDPVFPILPEWMHATVKGFTGHIWAPDISFHDGIYHLFYSVSAFGKNTSCIGHATNRTLDPDSPDYQWDDHGIVLQSFPGITNWNAIDPNIVVDDNGKVFMSFGSFWGGLFIAEMKDDLSGLAEDWRELTCIAARSSTDPEGSESGGIADGPGERAIEAPFIHRHDGYYYLFASIDLCCRGAESTYKMIVGRSRNVKGPYVDSEDRPMLEGGGDMLLSGDSRWHAVGHNGVSSFGDGDYLVYHGYDTEDPAGRARLLLRRIQWTWPLTLGEEE